MSGQAEHMSGAYNYSCRSSSGVVRTRPVVRSALLNRFALANSPRGEESYLHSLNPKHNHILPDSSAQCRHFEVEHTDRAER